jgi:CheY-like chemotaxis protein
VGTELAAAPQILVVDPDDDTRALYTQSLALAGCDVMEASDGREALATALVRPPGLVITEIWLPLVDGFALCEILRRDRATAGVPILVVTAEARPVEMDRARRAGADAVLVKPTPIETILGEMRRLVAPANRVSASTTHGRTPRTKAYSRFVTTTPAASAPALRCPLCDHPLTYECSHIGGVSDRHPEQWDYYVCPASCGTFQYRQRTRKLRRADRVSARARR